MLYNYTNWKLPKLNFSLLFKFLFKLFVILISLILGIRKISQIFYWNIFKFLSMYEGGVHKIRPQREGFVKSERLWTWGRGVGEMRTSAKFWAFSTKFDINLDKNF